MPYAAKTTVDVTKTKMEIEKLLTKQGATGFMIGWVGGLESVAFELDSLRIRFSFPEVTEGDVAHDSLGRPRSSANLKGGTVKTAMEQFHRTRWRELLLLIRAKLVAVESGIVTVESEFHSNIILPDGRTFGEWSAPYLKNAYLTGELPPMLPPASNERRLGSAPDMKGESEK